MRDRVLANDKLESGSSKQEDESDHGAMTPERSRPVTTLRKTPGRLSVSRAPGRASRAPAKLAEQLRRGDAKGSHLRFADHRITSFRRRGEDNGRLPRRARKAMDGGSGRGLLAPAEVTQRRSVFHRLGRPSPSSSAKWTLPRCVFSSSQVPSGCCLDRSKSIASSIRESGTSPTERKYSRARSTS